jgi:hypothetical protein
MLAALFAPVAGLPESSPFLLHVFLSSRYAAICFASLGSIIRWIAVKGSGGTGWPLRRLSGIRTLEASEEFKVRRTIKAASANSTKVWILAMMDARVEWRTRRQSFKIRVQSFKIRNQS